MRNKFFLTLLALQLACFPLVSSAEEAAESDVQQVYFKTLAGLCGAKYAGEMTFPESGQDSFAGKLLLAEFAECAEDQLKIPFTVGEDKSRTWIVRQVQGGLELKHDHRHKDGTPDEITNYGGTTADLGTQLSQSFPADTFTAELIPEAATNVWQISLSDDLSVLTYHLTRHQKPRFTAVLQRVSQDD